jgi:AraC-like DNA-binding protein
VYLLKFDPISTPQVMLRDNTLFYRNQPVIIFNDIRKPTANTKCDSSMLLYVSGPATININKHTISVTRSSVLLVPAFEPGQMQIVPESESIKLLKLRLTKELIWDYVYTVDRSFDFRCLNKFTVFDDEQFAGIFHSLLLYESLEIKLAEMLLRNRIFEIFYLLSALLYKHRRKTQLPERSLSKVDLMNKLSDAITSNQSIEQLASEFGVSSSTLKRYFVKHFSVSIKTWVNSQRLEKAKFLLSTSDLTVKEISYELGFNSPAYFIKVYKQRFKLTPATHRRSASICDTING